jgi:hypothetical protein
MDHREASQLQLHCPSAPPEWDSSVVLGVVGGTAEQPHLAHLREPLPVTNELLSLAAPVNPTEVFRFAAPCAGSACSHFDGTRCTLVTKMVDLLPGVGESLPPCFLRPHCRWWRQEGRAACVRCPQIVTEGRGGSRPLQEIADPGRAPDR